MYFLYVGWRALATGEFVLVRSVELGWVALVVVYPLLLLVALLLGYVAATVLAWTGAETSTQVADVEQ